MKIKQRSLTALVMLSTFASLSALGATGVGSINHDITFSGTIDAGTTQWVWSLPQSTVRIDLQDSDAVVDAANSTKSWDIMQNSQPYKFLEGYMEPTIAGQVMQSLNVDVKYLQDGAEVTPTSGDNNATVLPLKATGNKTSTAIDGELALTLQPVLLLAQETGGSTTLDGKPLASSGVTDPQTNATQAYANAKVKLESQLSAINATEVTYDTSATWPVTTLADGTEVTSPMIGGYASTITEGKLSFPDSSSVSEWESVITVQVQYK